MESKKIVWDLFGGLNGSVGLALEDHDKFEIYTVDILPKTKDGRENIVIDLADENQHKLLKKLQKTLPKPDIIVASPMCQSFSKAATCAGGNASWQIDDYGFMYIREDHSECKRNYNSERLIKNAKLGSRAARNTVAIIEYFEPDFWYVENPTSSLIWRHIFTWWAWEGGAKLSDGTRIKFNDTYYNNYGTPYKKPTTFASNVDLKLKKENIKAEMSFEYAKGGYENRSDIPKKLIQDIFKRFEDMYV